MMTDQNITAARKAFEKRHHQATLIQNTDRYTIIDWRRGDGDGEYYVNYIVDKKRGSLVISGDLGDCIATWYDRNSVHNITQYVRSIGYFIEKFQCSSDRYNYDIDDCINEIDEELDHTDAKDDEDFASDWEEFKEIVPDCLDFCDGFRANDDAEEFLRKYLGDDWWDGSSAWGRRISMRVYLWAVGLNMAVKQLDDAGLLTKED